MTPLPCNSAMIPSFQLHRRHACPQHDCPTSQAHRASYSAVSDALSSLHIRQTRSMNKRLADRSKHIQALQMFQLLDHLRSASDMLGATHRSSSQPVCYSQSLQICELPDFSALRTCSKILMCLSYQQLPSPRCMPWSRGAAYCSCQALLCCTNAAHRAGVMHPKLFCVA